MAQQLPEAETDGMSAGHPNALCSSTLTALSENASEEKEAKFTQVASQKYEKASDEVKKVQAELEEAADDKVSVAQGAGMLAVAASSIFPAIVAFPVNVMGKQRRLR